MGSFLVWLAEQERKVDAGSILVDLPSARQQTKYSCGAAALRSIGAYYGVGPQTEMQWIKLIKSTPKDGTRHAEIARVARQLGLRVESKQGMTLDELQRHLDRHRPVICDIQAWGSRKQYSKDQSGHYVVAIGYDAKNVVFMDPSTGGSRGVIPKNEFLSRWHDVEGKGEPCCHRLGIVIYKPGAETRPQTLRHAVKVK